MSWPLVLVLGKNDSNDEVAQSHAQGSECESRSSSDAIDIENRWNCGKQHDNTNNTSGEKGGGVVGEAEGTKDLKQSACSYMQTRDKPVARNTERH